MTELTERERQIVAWLRGGPFPWLHRKATLRERFRAAWRILTHGEKAVSGLLILVALKIASGEPWGEQA